MKTFALRLKPKQDLRQAIEVFTQDKTIKSGFILTAVGSLKQASIRFADRNKATVLQEKFEILALSGTLTITGVHLHLTIADCQGKTIGGHLETGCIIYTTAEIVIGVSEDFTFLRTVDEQTGYKELEILPSQ